MNNYLEKFEYFVFLALGLSIFSIGFIESAGNFYGTGARDKKEISITFDDGPAKATDEILDILRDTYHFDA